MSVEAGEQNQQGPLDKARKFLMMLAVAAPSMVGTPQGAVGQERYNEPDLSTTMGELGKTFVNLGKVLGEMAREKEAELKHAAELGPDVERALKERLLMLDLMVDTKMQLQRVEHNMDEAADIETMSGSTKVYMADEFKQKNGVTPQIFLRQAPAIVEKLKETIKIQEGLFDVAGSRYFSLLEAAEKKAEKPRDR